MPVTCSKILFAGVWLVMACGTNTNADGLGGAGGHDGPAKVEGGGAELSARAACASPVGLADLEGAQVVGTGAAVSCTEDAVRAAILLGGKVRFQCGDEPVVIAVKKTLYAPLDVVIDGENKISLSGGKAHRILLGASGKTLTLQRLTLQDGYTEDPVGAGGVHTSWRGNLTVVQCLFTGNVGAGRSDRAGGAISTHESRLVIVDSTFENNQGNLGGALNLFLSDAELINLKIRNNIAREFGGAVYIDGAGVEFLSASDPKQGFRGVGGIHMCGSAITENRGGTTAGGLYFCGYDANTAVIERSLFTNNESKGPGGGIVVQCNARMTITQSLIANNRAHSGGGIWTVCGRDDCKTQERRTIIKSSSVVGNECLAKNTVGGGIYASAPVDLEAVTIARNRAHYGGALSGGQNVWARDVLIVDNAIFNTRGASAGCGKGGLAKAQGVLEWPRVQSTKFDSPCQDNGPTGDPMLGPLADHGGPTHTCAIQASGAAAGKGAACIGVDQRGNPRALPCDIGAFQTLP